MDDKKNKTLTRDEQLELEQQAIETLLQYGVKFTVPLKIEPKEPPKWIRMWNKLFPKHIRIWRDKRIPKNWNVEKVNTVDMNENITKDIYVRTFHIKPLYLGTGDMIRRLALKMEYSEEDVHGNPIEESERLLKFRPLMAEIVAIATLNCADAAEYKSLKVKELKKFFLTHLTHGKLQQLCSIVAKMNDKAGFINSIRLTLQVGTTQPKASRVE